MMPTLDELYGETRLSGEEIDALIDRSLTPRPPEMLYDRIVALGLGADHFLLDVGCRDARHTCEVARRTGCRALGIDPVKDNIALAQSLIVEANLASRVGAIDGRIETLPLGDATVDFIWCRDVLSHVVRLETGMTECMRVLRPGGAMLVYITVGTELLEPGEAGFICESLAVVPSNLSAAHLEAAFTAAGLVLEERDIVGSEWREYWEESGEAVTSHQLLRVARMRRDRERLVTIMGETIYASDLANCLWGVYQMLGKLRPTVYVLRRPE